MHEAVPGGTGANPQRTGQIDEGDLAVGANHDVVAGPHIEVKKTER